MKDSKEVAVLIPIYAEEPTALELASLRQCFDILQDHPIIFFAPLTLNINFYKKLLGEYGQVYVERFDDKYFLDVSSYNRLMLQRKFYRRFEAFEYILIYQLDAWVFRDELLDWCRQQYAYIGAPWFSADKPTNGLSHFMGVGNGGFSLRNVKKHLRVLNTFSYILSPFYLVPKFLKQMTATNFRELILNLLTQNNTHYLFGKNNLNEDVFWYQMTLKFKWFRAPDMYVACRFATETKCETIYQINNGQLPFGCHGWQTYEPEFWSGFILIDKKL